MILVIYMCVPPVPLVPPKNTVSYARGCTLKKARDLFPTKRNKHTHSKNGGTGGTIHEPIVLIDEFCSPKGWNPREQRVNRENCSPTSSWLGAAYAAVDAGVDVHDLEIAFARWVVRDISPRWPIDEQLRQAAGACIVAGDEDLARGLLR